MTVKVAINGFGRIGRLVARAMLERGDTGMELVAINDLADAKSNAWLFSRDSVHGKYPGKVSAEGNDLVVDGKRIRVTAERDPAKLPHAELGVDIVLECTGFFTDRESGVRRQQRQAGGRAQYRLERVVHDQLPGAGRQGAERQCRHRARADDDGARLYQ
jgi:glyceraldehyde-3-phosphate dehydrogenase/erythrose-4-phosphate dehydrogenase